MKTWLIFLATIILIQLLFFIIPSQNFLLPSPFDVLNALYVQLRQGEILIDMAMSLERVVVGFFLAVIIAIHIGILCGYSQKLGSFFRPFV
ncbi:MAG: hypothetical protein PHF44_02150 [Candidatus Pacebacteria bacterium]|nr:hypothetical protein [Candidatus Paceibacterota bacterium]